MEGRNFMIANKGVVSDTSIIPLIKQLGNQSNKAYVIVEYTAPYYKIIASNKKYTELTQFTQEEIIGKSILTLFVQNRYHNGSEEIERILRAEQMCTHEFLHMKKHGTFCSKVQCLPFQNQYFLLFVEDITIDQLDSYIHQLERTMFLAIEQGITFNKQLELICSEVDVLFNPYTYTSITMKMNSGFSTILSNRFDEIQAHEFFVSNENEKKLYETLIQENQVIQLEDFGEYPINEDLKRYLLERNYQNCWFIPIVTKQGEGIGVMTMFFDLQKRNTEMYEQLFYRLMELIVMAYDLEQQQSTINELAYVDQATGLPNIHQFQKIINQLKAMGIEGIIKIVEANEFSNIVEIYGRDIGDVLLKELGERIKKSSTSDIFHIARFTSSSLIIFSTRDFEMVRQEAQPFKSITANPFHIKGITAYVTLKSGFAAFNPKISCKDTIRFAEVALENAKSSAGMQTAFYDGNMDCSRQKEMKLLNHLTEAIRNNEIQTYFQPKVMLHRERIVSVEALARWNSRELGFVSPVEFIPIAENAGLISEIDLQMLEQILKWMQKRQYEGKRIIPVALNISPNHFYQPNFIPNIKRLIQQYYIDPNYIIIEVTEGIGLVDLKRAKKILKDLHKIGVKTSVDDFGIGYSSLSYLQKLSFNELKIDRSFTWKLHEMGTYAIVKAIIEIAHTLEMNVIAEGVETQQQAKQLRELRCDIAQGYFYYKPMDLETFEKRFDER